METSSPSLTPSNDLTLHDLAGILWFPSIEHSRPNTVRRYRVAYKNHIRAKWGSRYADTIKPNEIQQWIGEMAKSGIPPRSIAFYRGVLSSILIQCVRSELIPSNPAQYAKLPKVRKRVRVTTVDEIRRLLSAVEGTQLAAPVFLAAVLGMRRGEACGLRWSRIDLKTGRVSVRDQRLVEHGQKKGKRVTTAELKSDTSERSFILPKSLLEALLRVGALDSDYVCVTNANNPWDPEHLTSLWARERERLGFKDWHYHDLRHAAASTLVAIGLDLLTVAAILGHKSIDATQLYAHAQEATASRGFDKLAEVLCPVDGLELKTV